MNIAEIIPLLRLPRSLGVFDYLIPETIQNDISVGSAVEIRFRGQRVIGIVVKLKKESAYKKLNEINKIIDPEPIADSKTLELFSELAHENFVSPSLFFRTILPEIPKRVAKPKPPTQKNLEFEKTKINEKFSEKITTILAEIEKTLKLSIRADDAEFVQTLILKLCSSALEQKTSLFILFPIQEHAATLTEFLQKQNIPAILTLPTDAKNKIYELWQALQHGEQIILIGTRQALFFPQQKNGLYILFDEPAEEWKQTEINPRFDARQILPKLARHYGAKTLIISPLFSINYLAEKPEIKDERIYSNSKTIVAKNARGLFTETIEEEMRDKKHALFYVHRKGKAALIRCRDCGYTAKCLSCDLSLAVHENFLRCPACQTQTEILLTCPKCGGSELVSYGVGAEQIQEKAQTQFPNTQITVTTVAFLNNWPITKPIPKFDLVAIIETDTALHRPDFRSNEKLARIVNRLNQISAKNQAPFIIQTQFPDLPIWKVGNQNESAFFEQEMTLREDLHLPPTWRLVKLIFQNPDKKIIEKQAEEVVKNLQSVIKDENEIEISSSYFAVPPQIRGQYHLLVLIRVKPEKLELLRPYLSPLSDDIIIDLDPSDVLR